MIKLIYHDMKYHDNYRLTLGSIGLNFIDHRSFYQLVHELGMWFITIGLLDLDMHPGDFHVIHNLLLLCDQHVGPDLVPSQIVGVAGGLGHKEEIGCDMEWVHAQVGDGHIVGQGVLMLLVF